MKYSNSAKHVGFGFCAEIDGRSRWGCCLSLRRAGKFGHGGFLTEACTLGVLPITVSSQKLNGMTNQNDFPAGYLLEQSGDLNRLLQSYGRPWYHPIVLG